MFNINRSPRYDEASVKPMRDELVAVGFTELRTSQDAENAILRNDDETVLVVINSVCGCAAGSARPGVSLALQNKVIPNNITTVFAGQDLDAVDKVRELCKNVPPSSPSMGLFRNGKLVFFLPRYEIEGRSADQIGGILAQVFDKECNGVGPSVPPEVFAKLETAQFCGSKIPKYSN